MKKMITAVDMVKLGVYGRLRAKYNDVYGEEESGLLAASVTNELFSELSPNRDARNYLKSNMNLVLNELKNLQGDKEICEVVTQAVRVKASVPFANKFQNKDSLMNPIEKLREIDLLVPVKHMLTPNIFLRKAYEFYKSIEKV